MAFVARDRRQPGGGLSRLGAGEHVAMGREEDLLRGVLGLVRVFQEDPAQAVHHPGVLFEERTQTLAGRLR